MGMSKEEQEQRLIYKKILQYEQDAVSFAIMLLICLEHTSLLLYVLLFLWYSDCVQFTCKIT